MTAAIAHRGPDSDGLWSCPNGTTVLGFRRLAIRDLDPRANQPMHSAAGRTTVVFNGEIYNTGELSAKYCPRVDLRTTGDTEVFLEAFERHGVDLLPSCNGMFAVAFYRHDERTLTLARDRCGKKPLYVYEGDGFLAFASELRAFRRFGLEPDPERVPYYLQFGYFPSPFTFFKNVSQVRPGEAVTVQAGRMIARRRFHDYTNLPWGESPDVADAALEQTLADAVSIRTLSDVPVGIFLSGGVDSSLVASCSTAEARGGTPLPAFTVAFDDARYNEAPFAAAIARRLGLPYTELQIDPRALPGLVDDYFDCYEQPYADMSGLPSMLLCRQVKDFVTVALSGDGGDEFFGGYTRYDWYRQALLAQRLPSAARNLLKKLAPAFDPRRGARIARLLEDHDEAGLYAAILRSWVAGPSAELLCDMPAADEAPVSLVRDVFRRLRCDPLAKAACFDASYYIPDDLQVKMDRASMRVALEVRCPLLDFRVAEFGARLASRTKFRGGKKSVLRNLLARRLPRELFERPKRGFAVPLARWMQGPLRNLVAETLAQRGLRECGWLNTAVIDNVQRQFHAGQPELARPLWLVFVLASALVKAREAAGATQSLAILERAA
jgi:asparagine synthase (glutamine-hydrolysing)